MFKKLPINYISAFVIFLAVIFFIVCQLGAYYFYKSMAPKKEDFIEHENDEK